MRSSRLLEAAACAVAVAGLGAAVAARDHQGGVATTGGQVRTIETQAVAPPPTPPKGVISGLITSGIDGTPITRARVVIESRAIYACPPTMPPGQSGTCPRFRRWILTDARGRYAVAELPKADDFVITATKSGFATRAFGEVPPNTAATAVALQDEEVRSDVNIVLNPDQDITGTVRDEDGSPFGGALVQAWRSRLVNGQRELVAVADAATDDAGRYHLFGLTPGTYLVSAADPSLDGVGDAKGALPYPATFRPGTVRAEDAATITLTEGTTATGIDIAMKIVKPAQSVPPAPTALASLPATRPASRNTKAAPPKQVPPPAPPTAVLSGRITSVATARPIARARVVVRGDALFACAPGTPTDQTATCPRFTRWTLTDEDGRWSIPELPRGKDFIVTVSKTGFAARSFGETPPQALPAYIDLNDAQIRAGIDVQLVPQTFITGTLLDEDATPLAGTVIEAQRAYYENGQRRFVSVANAITDDTGGFRLVGLPPGQFFITAFDPTLANVGDQKGQLFYGPTFYPGTPYQDDATRITINPGLPVVDLTFTIKIIRPARVTGKITTGSELILLAGAVNMGPIRNQKIASLAISEADIRPDGIFQFANILAERYLIRTRGEVERSTSDRQALSYFAQYSLPVQGQDEADIDLTLVPGAEVKGRVTWDGRATKPPVDQSMIRVRAPMADGATFGDALTGVIDLDHNFYLRGVMAGNHMIRVEGLPEPWRLKKVLWRSADVTDISMPMESRVMYDGFEVVLTDVNTSLAGTISVAPGDLAQAYGIVIFSSNRNNWQPNSRFLKLAYVDDRGLWGVRGLPPGEYFIAVTRDADESDLTNPDVLDQLSRQAQLVRLADGERRSLPLTAPDPRRRVGRE